MINLSLGTAVSLLVAGATLGIELLIPTPAQAATFNFSYTFSSYEGIPNSLLDIPAGSVLSGVLEGDIQSDGNTVTNIRSLSAVYKIPFVTGQANFANFDGLYPEFTSNFITLDGSAINLLGWNSQVVRDSGEFLGFSLSFGTSGFGLGFGSGLINSASVFYEDTVIYEPFNPNRWSVSQVDHSKTVPEPDSLLALALFSIGCLSRRALSE